MPRAASQNLCFAHLPCGRAVPAVVRCRDQRCQVAGSTPRTFNQQGANFAVRLSEADQLDEDGDEDEDGRKTPTRGIYQEGSGMLSSN